MIEQEWLNIISSLGELHSLIGSLHSLPYQSNPAIFAWVLHFLASIWNFSLSKYSWWGYYFFVSLLLSLYFLGSWLVYLHRHLTFLSINYWITSFFTFFYLLFQALKNKSNYIADGQLPRISCSSHFSNVTKTQIFINLNSRKKGNRNFLSSLLEKKFQAPTIILKTPKLIRQILLLCGYLLRDKKLKFTFLKESTFQV